MDFAVKTEYFKKVVSCVSRATANKAIQPILNNILLSCTNGSVLVKATDLDMAIECKLAAEVSEKGEVTLPAKKLDEIVSKVPGEEVNIKIDKNQLAKIISNKSKFQINGTTTEDYPEVIKKQEGEKIFSIKQEELLNAISLTAFATSRFEPTSTLSGASFHIENNTFEIAATDGCRIARYIGKLSEGQKIKESVVIPSRALQELERLLINFKEGNEFVSFYLMPGQIIFQNNDFTLSTRLLSGVFPSYDKLIPKAQSNKLVVSRTELLASLDRVAILANDRTNVIRISIEKGGKTLKLNAQSPDYGNATDEVEVEYKGSDFEITFNYKYLAEGLRSLQLEKLLFELENSLCPIIVKPNEEVDYNYTYLVMPVQQR